YLSSNGEAFTSRTAGFIIQPHFPPGITNTAPGPLTGVGLSSLPFSDINHFRNPATPAAGIGNTSLSGNPGGVPLYKGGVCVGAVGVDSSATLSALVYVPGLSNDENVAVAAQSGYNAPPGIVATNVLLNGIRLPYISSTNGGYGTVALNPVFEDPAFPITASTGLPFNTTTPSPFPGITGTVRNQIQGSALGPVNGQPRLSRSEVLQILKQGAQRANITRAAIRSPAGVSAQVFIVVVDYYNPATPPGSTPGDGTNPPTNVPEVLGSFRTSDATLFSYDVAAQKARTALFFSNNTMALSARTVGFLAQGTYPPGIDGTAPGPYGPPIYGASNAGFLATTGVPFFTDPADGYGLQVLYSLSHTALAGATPIALPVISTVASPDPYLPNGITVFPGGFPLYRNGQLIGAVGVSGDGVDQDDIISASATVGFEAPVGIRADEFEYRGARLPYAKFPQNSTLSGY
ncbi:MAG TPA: heme-binding protein, partial [Candidatus Methylacidiphilales bacterium]|nr:heme-binding protein [Candidatus Methylacidiphilales bacterium]